MTQRQLVRYLERREPIQAWEVEAYVAQAFEDERIEDGGLR